VALCWQILHWFVTMRIMQARKSSHLSRKSFLWHGCFSLQMSVPFQFGSSIQLVPLANSEPSGSASAVVSGWGTTSSGSSSLPTQLQAVTVNIVSASQCNSAYSDYGGITENTFCAGGLSGRFWWSSACCWITGRHCELYVASLGISLLKKLALSRALIITGAI
jgi:hypothetical protein